MPEQKLLIPPTVAASLVLVRHGESTWIAEGRFQGRQNPPLSTLGQRQAELVGLRLAHRDERTPLPIPAGPPIGIWHSPLSRVAATAKAIAEAQSGRVPRHALEQLTEIAQGEWEGQPQAVVKTRWARELNAWRLTPTRSQAPGGERLLDAAARVRGGLGEILAALTPPASDADARSSDAAGVIASLRHDPVPGYPSSEPEGPPEPWAIVVAHDGIFRLLVLQLLRMPLTRFWSLPFNLCAITVVTIHDGVAALRAHNLSDHLAPLADEERAAQEARGERRGAL
ncbi:MAG TPA: histidine phosphatase family protein [Candidatus Limnocylindrales bacterium]|nr:histidine phosphatase family protein [Candidatus Limnocylindrales bacterium]